MAGVFRIPGILGASALEFPIDKGTLCLNPSFSPRSIPPRLAPMASQQQARPSSPQPVGNGPFELAVGQLTFDAEGQESPTSAYFSRVVHWPGGISGVTLGRGYDMGTRTATVVAEDLVAAGLDGKRAAAFAAGAGMSGSDAKAFVEKNKAALGQISPEVQKALFERIFPTYVADAVKNYDKWTLGETDRLPWTALDAPIRDVLVDFVYQGFTKGGNPMKKGMRNDYDELILYIETTAVLVGYEAGRRRAPYLRRRKPAKGAPSAQ